MAFTADIVEETVSSETDKRLKLAKGAYMRAPEFGTDWTKMRILMRLSFDTAKANDNYSGYPAFWFGLMNGATTPPGSATPGHFAGVKFASILKVNTNAVYLTYNSTASATHVYPAVIKNGVATVASGSVDLGGSASINKTSNGRAAIGITLERSGTDMIVTPYGLNGVSLAAYKAAIESTLDVPAGFNSPSSTPTISPDEATYGDLDTIVCAFTGGDDSIQICDIRGYRMA